MTNEIIGNNDVTDTSGEIQQNQAEKTYTQAEFDKHVAGLKASLTRKFEKQFEGLGDVEELRQLKAQAESKKVEDSKKRGEYEKLLQELAAKKDSEISKRDSIIKDYKINTPLLSAAASMKAVNAEQVKALLSGNLRLNEDGEVEVIDTKGSVRITDKGTPLSVEDLVREFLDSNPHFVAATPSTANTKSSHTQGTQIDIASLDMKNPEHRKRYKELTSSKR